jgi:hypothetical protein
MSSFNAGVGAGGCCTAANFFDSHAALITITGAIVGGPDQSDNYPDLRPDYQRSEVALDYNAGFTGAAAALAQYAAAGQLAACGAGGCYVLCYDCAIGCVCAVWIHVSIEGLQQSSPAGALLCSVCMSCLKQYE